MLLIIIRNKEATPLFRGPGNANLHYLAGFWVLLPLAMLSFTGAWISFPKVFSQFENNPAPAGQSREQAMRARDQQRLAATAA